MLSWSLDQMRISSDSYVKSSLSSLLTFVDHHHQAETFT